ncbi:MAG: hypothetical protein HXX16_05645 [Bacteroidales bacterium]|nr:hypothetical protein [Bacteroidales bacterium]
MKTTEIRKIFLWLTLFSIAMAFLETSVVVYLRKLYYPEGFNFPMKMMDKDIAIVELFRELATLVMLLGAGFIAGRSKTEKFGLFLYSFAIWDIFYYVFLKITLNWPESLFTWDVLFLIPTTWVGPVIAPVIVSLFMIVFAFLISKFTNCDTSVNINKYEWLLLVSGSIILIIGFVYDYVKFMLQFFSLGEIFSPSNTTRLMEKALTYVPVSFPWLIFTFGIVIIIGGIALFYRRNKHNLNRTLL